MSRRALRRLLFIAVLAALSIGIGGGKASADPNRNARLRGTYAINAVLACVQNQAGFTASPELALLGPANTRTVNVDGVIRFNGDGTGTVQARALTIFHSPPSRLQTDGQPVSESEFAGNLDYTVNPDGTFTAELNVSGTVLSGDSANASLDISNIMRQGRIGQGARSLVISNTFANVEDVQVGSQSFKRICGRSGAAVKINGDGD